MACRTTTQYRFRALRSKRSCHLEPRDSAARRIIDYIYFRVFVSEAPSQQGKPGKRGRMRRKNTLVQSKISAVNVPVSLRRSGIFTLFGGIFTLSGGNFTLSGGVFTLPGGFFSLPGGIFALPGGMFACLAEFCPVWWGFRLVWWGFCFLPGLVGF